MIPLRVRPLLTVVATVIVSLMVGAIAPAVHAAKFKQVDWSDFIETPEERAKWDRKVAERAKNAKGAVASADDEPRAKMGKAKKSKKAKKAKKSRAKSRSGKRKRG